MKFFDSEKQDDKKSGESAGRDHYATDAEHHMQDGFGTNCFLFSRLKQLCLFVSNQHYNNQDKYEKIEEHTVTEAKVQL